ncbi:hypothetical protein [Leifsonia aquatica]|uniref:hypothetical protein n=1 Tax=Leifsonia aquatica TaxID=144185 RepID=UPI00046AEB0F|nr:hypothetical protein [Leifsonia aquatica]
MTLTAPAATAHHPSTLHKVHAAGDASRNRVVIRDDETHEEKLQLTPSAAEKLIRDLQGALALLDVFARARSQHAGDLYEAMRDANEHDPEHDPNVP